MKSQIEEQLQQLRSQATELLFKEDYSQYINLYTHFISICEKTPTNSADVNKPLLLALSNRAEAHHKLRNFCSAIEDCNQALEINPCHMKSIICKGKSLLKLDRYSHASECFQNALFLNKSEAVFELLEKSKKLDAISRSGQIDISDWLINGCNGKLPDLAEYIGSVEVRKSKSGIRGLFATKNIDVGTTLVITKAVVIGRGILPETGCRLAESAKMVMWRGFVDRIVDAIDKSKRTLYLIYLLSMDSGEEGIPDMGLFKPETEEEMFYLENMKGDGEKIAKVLEVNCLNEEAASSKVIGNRTAINNCCGVGLWILPSFVNHSCSPNARRVHIGDWLVMHASRSIKAGEEITFAYFDVLLPLNERKELCRRWGFECKCERCAYEEKDETMRDIEKAFGKEYDVEKLILWLEDDMRKNMKEKKEKGFGRASFWNAYVRVYESEKMTKRLGMKICKELVFGENLMDVIGGDERILRLILERFRKNGNSFDGGSSSRFVEMEKIMKIGRGVYGKLVKKHGLKILFQFLNN